MPKISVICVTNREGAVEFLLEQLTKQTFQDFELIVADDSVWKCKCNTGKARYVGRSHGPFIIRDDYYIGGSRFIPREKNGGDAWNLNKAYNDCLDKVQGELIVFLQDFIEIPANGLERFYELYTLYPNTLITGCGHKYAEGIIRETDDRVHGDRKLVPSDWTYYELNWASCPTKLAPRFLEEMDTHYGGENQIFALRANSPVMLDRMNECKGLVHTDRPSNWEEKHSNKGYLNEIIKQYGRR